MKYFTIWMIIIIIVTSTFIVVLDVDENIFGSYMKNRYMEDTQGYYDHEDVIRGLHVSMGNEETKSNGNRSRVEIKELVDTMKSLQK